jgi:xanthine dehydrogenase YagR molybdenum-binding subunit
VDGRLKVTGKARYAAEIDAPGLLHACVVTSNAAAGQVLSIDSREARRAAGAVAVFTHKNFPSLQPAPVALQMEKGRLAVESITFDLGDTEMPVAPISAGSMTTASVGSAVKDACEKLVRRAGGAIVPALLARAPLSADGEFEPGAEAEKFSRCSFGAHFAEVHIDRDTLRIRVPRLLGAYAAGKIINPKTARSQLVGGMVWAIGMALLEGSHLCPISGRVITDSLADHLVPTNPDIHGIVVLLIDEEDRIVNPLGVKGIGEPGIIAAPAAIANAVYHATRIRIRDLPITVEKLLQHGLS